MTEPVTADGADREAYLSLNMLPKSDATDVRAGRWDHVTGVQAFARHRATATAPLEARIAALEGAMREAVGALKFYASDANYRPFHDEDGEESIPCIPCGLSEVDEEGNRYLIYDLGDTARNTLASLRAMLADDGEMK